MEKVEEKEGEGGGISLAGQEPHHVPVSGENAELHQVAENAENLQ